MNLTLASLIFLTLTFATTHQNSDVGLTLGTTTPQTVISHSPDINIKTHPNNLPNTETTKYNSLDPKYDRESAAPALRVHSLFTFTSLFLETILSLATSVQSRVLDPTNSGPSIPAHFSIEKHQPDIENSSEYHSGQEIQPRTHICTPTPPFPFCYTYTPPQTTTSISTSISTHLSPPRIFTFPMLVLNGFGRLKGVLGAAIPSATSQGLGDEERKKGVRSYEIAERILEGVGRIWARFGGWGGDERGEKVVGGEMIGCSGGNWRGALRGEWRGFLLGGGI